MSMKNSNDTIGNRTRDLPACSAMPQLTALPRRGKVPYCVFISVVQQPNSGLGRLIVEVSRSRTSSLTPLDE